MLKTSCLAANFPGFLQRANFTVFCNSRAENLLMLTVSLFLASQNKYKFLLELNKPGSGGNYSSQAFKGETFLTSLHATANTNVFLVHAGNIS